MGLDFEPELGLADNGDLEHDLQALLEAVGMAARKAGTALVMFADEGRMGRAKSYAERLFDFSDIGALAPPEAAIAISKPLADLHVAAEPEALQMIIQETRGYPHFLQEWGRHAWDVAKTSPITALDVKTGSREAIAALDESFFRVRFDRLTPVEKRYLRAMAEIGPGPHRSGDVAQRLGRKVTSLGPTRNQLISKGMIWSPSHGDTAFTAPLFDEFMRRIMPGDDWKES